ncbi:SagB/ThcOx family dehydrogenase [Pseudomonas sp. BMS12]|uniref:SagB/ThcOx family dehydrogenase n=1 Tax=Pseudomonas sp. BMS12 TaxID=1796033 RepID=UPI00083B7A92|nr:SagB/ThcOx family dehydrogenase [Pseudomonas sp. BMS12]
MDAEQQVRAYHALSKHAPNAYAPGPGHLDWATQPAPFRRYAGSRLLELWQRPLEETPAYDQPFAGPTDPPVPLSRASLAQLLYDSLALSAWKEAGGNRWALRVNPSSGNLHPTEAYLLLPPGAVEAHGLLAHYAPDAHALEVRAELPAPLGQQLAAALPAGGFLLGLASIPWREAWKYGERAYRYCQHDLGHALACVSIAAAIQGWQVRLLRGVAEARLDGLLGLDRDGFHEAEHSDCLLWIGPPAEEFSLPETLLRGLAALELSGAPNRLSRQYREWPELARVHGLCRAPVLPALGWQAPLGYSGNDNPGLPLRPILHRRRSAQAFDGCSGILAELLFAWLRRLLPAHSPVPFAVTGEKPQVDLLLFVHRVQGLEPGLYWLARGDGQPQPDGLRGDFTWQRVHAELPLYRLLEGDARGLAGFLSCGQDIASDGCVALAMLARFDQALAEGAWQYPQLYWECGQIGQLLYLEAEAAGLSGTGIGCFFDDQVHELLELADSRWQSLYHFTIGRAVWDERLSSAPAYPDLRVPPRSDV